MTIGVDIRALGSGRHSGVEEYLVRLLEQLIPLDPGIRYKLFYSSYRQPLADYAWLRAPNVEMHRFRIPNRILLAGGALLGWPRLDSLIGGCDVFFSPHFLPAPLSPGVRRVTTFHDLSFLRFPEFFPWQWRWWHRLVAPAHAAKFSDRLIAVSDSTARDLENFYGIDPARVTRIYSGVASTLVRPAESEISRFRYDRNLPAKYILFLGTLEPRKNIIGLVRVFERVPDPALHLVVAGSPGWLYRDILKIIAASPASNRIHLFGPVREHERAPLYAAARAFVYPSFFEGFGLPPLEAMACGTPVIASQNSSLPEVIGQAGILVNPHSISDLVVALNAVLTDSDLAEKLSSRGLERAKTFTWDRTALETLEVLKTV